jgi:hypothetical protein
MKNSSEEDEEEEEEEKGEEEKEESSVEDSSNLGDYTMERVKQPSMEDLDAMAEEELQDDASWKSYVSI